MNECEKVEKVEKVEKWEGGRWEGLLPVLSSDFSTSSLPTSNF